MNEDLKFHIRAMSRFVYVVTEEEDRFLVQLRALLSKAEKRIHVYNSAFGMVPITSLVQDWASRAHKEQQVMDIHSALISMYKDDPGQDENFYVITDPDRWLTDPQVVRRLLNLAHQLHQNDKIIKITFFVGPRLVMPQKLQRYIEVVHDRGPDSEEIKSILSNIASKIQSPPSDTVIRALQGLTSYEVDAATSQSIIATKKDKTAANRFDVKFINAYKRRQLRKTDLINYVDVSNDGFDKVGGVARFKTWVEKHKASWTREGQKFGLKPPKGVLLVGVWGCGKSISVKALGNAWNLPVVQLDLGKLRQSGVGDSEANVYRAINLIESVAPCVTGETEVTLADGTTRPIAALWQDHLCDPTQSLRVMCWNEKTLKVETTNVRGITLRQAEAFRVSAANGFYLNATGNHQHYVMRGGLPEWVRTDELFPGDMLAVPVAKYDGNEDCGRFHPPGTRQYDRPDGGTELRRGEGGFRDAIVPKLPLQLTTDLGWLLGALEGDGFIGIRDGIGFTNTSPVLLTKFEQVLAEQFGLSAVRRLHVSEEIPDLPGLSEDPSFKPCWTTVVTNQLAAEMLRNLRTGILTAPLQVRAAFLAGWVDADGCVGPNKVTLTVKHPKMLFERQLLARQLVQSLGVVPSKFEYPNMEITGSRSAALAAAIGEFLVEKSAKAALVTSNEGFDRGMGFACGKLLSDIRAESSVLIKDLQKAQVSTSVMWRHENGVTPISERYLKKYSEVLGEQASDLQRLLAAECRWVEIKDVESVGQCEVYDLVCEGADTHSFFANGLVTHNCIVWVDEAEKSLSGGQSSGASDAGTTSRMIGALSTWVQETQSEVCLAMTVNSLKTLPIEFIRRMNERFFFDLPSEDERIDILKIHLLKKKQDPKSFKSLAKLAEDAKLMVGSEIEHAIETAMTESFHAGKATLDEDILSKELRNKPRIFKTLADELKEVLDWVGFDPDTGDGIRARFASETKGEGFRAHQTNGQ